MREEYLASWFLCCLCLAPFPGNGEELGLREEGYKVFNPKGPCLQDLHGIFFFYKFDLRHGFLVNRTF